jgi:DNA-binding NarL/FixJ family response regulator
VARSHGHLYALPHLYTIQSFTLTKLGRLGEALESAEDAEEGARTFGATDILALAGTAKLHPLLWGGGPEAVGPAWEQARRLPEPDSDWFRISVSTMILDIGLQLGAEVPRDAARLLDLGQDRQTDPMLAARWGLAAQISAIEGDGAQAQSWGARSVEIATRMGLAGHRGTALLCRAVAARTLADHAAAVAYAQDAAQAFREAGQPVHEARALLLAAESAIEGGPADTAEEDVNTARALFHEYGAHWLERAAARAQRRLTGRRTHRAGGSLPTLTERERQVAELVAEGLTNQRIGDRLALSPRTVETYVTRLLTKLEASSRAGIARRLERLPEPSDTDTPGAWAGARPPGSQATP